MPRTVHHTRRKTTTFRLEPEILTALAALSARQGRPMNQLVNEAVRQLLVNRGRVVDADVEATIDRLQADRAPEPMGQRSLAAAMAAEAAVEDDPAEGVRIPHIRFAGPVSARVLERLGRRGHGTSGGR